ncbi:hypothetical protein CTEN210_03439 [Chaetoceros tenuissimus]|uniref:Uncharacterized protein n=1 Tax=Chaetoceros tenuissimus TaxID=426638 RepID=A0AAD3CLI5_9STRA|nr:hypothetical protein CTEN210_03439 [Chaetoceros tenuissimus]
MTNVEDSDDDPTNKPYLEPDQFIYRFNPTEESKRLLTLDKFNQFVKEKKIKTLDQIFRIQNNYDIVINLGCEYNPDFPKDEDNQIKGAIDCYKKVLKEQDEREHLKSVAQNNSKNQQKKPHQQTKKKSKQTKKTSKRKTLRAPSKASQDSLSPRRKSARLSAREKACDHQESMPSDNHNTTAENQASDADYQTKEVDNQNNLPATLPVTQIQVVQTQQPLLAGNQNDHADNQIDHADNQDQHQLVPPYQLIMATSCIFELDIIPLFPELGFYKRYIDDSLGLWTPLQDNDLQRREEFKRVVSTFGANDQFFKDNPSLKPLQWEVEDFSSSAVFLDLNIHLDVNGICHTSIYEKSLNLYLYIPPHSCHAPGVTKSVIFGMVHRAVTLFSDKTKIPDYLKLCFNRLVRRGHRPSVIKPLFAEAIQKHASGSSCSRASTSSDRPLVFQLPYNPLDPNRKKIQAAFKDCILEPPNEDPWSSLSANDTGAPPNINRLIVCYRRQPSLGTLLAPRKLRFSQDFSISQYYEKYQVMNPAPTT